MILPAMGIASEVISNFSRKPIFGYRAMVYAMAAIAFLSWIVWGHHMFQSGMNPALGTSFMNPLQYDFLKPLQGINVFISISAFVLGAAQFLFLANILYGYFFGEKASENPWHANTLEWTAPSPPPHGNWPGKVPVVYRGPYEFSSPEHEEDYWMQSEPPQVAAAAAD